MKLFFPNWRSLLGKYKGFYQKRAQVSSPLRPAWRDQNDPAKAGQAEQDGAKGEIK